jgi:hypothetical protein
MHVISPFARWLKRKTSDKKKEATPKRRGLKRKTSDEKRDNPKMEGAQKKRPLIKKEATPKRKGLKRKTSDEKRGNSKIHGVETKGLREKRGRQKMLEGEDDAFRVHLKNAKC